MKQKKGILLIVMFADMGFIIGATFGYMNNHLIIGLCLGLLAGLLTGVVAVFKIGVKNNLSRGNKKLIFREFSSKNIMRGKTDIGVENNEEYEVKEEV